jgi:hypothetical protein
VGKPVYLNLDLIRLIERRSLFCHSAALSFGASYSGHWINQGDGSCGALFKTLSSLDDQTGTGTHPKTGYVPKYPRTQVLLQPHMAG